MVRSQVEKASCNDELSRLPNRLPSIHVLKCALAKCLSLLLPSYNEAKQVEQNHRSHFLIANAKREHAACSHAHILSLHAAVQSHTETQHHRINCRGRMAPYSITMVTQAAWYTIRLRLGIVSSSAMSHSTNIFVILYRTKCKHTAQNIHWLRAMTITTSGHWQQPHRANNGSISAPPWLKDIMSVHRGEAEACVAKRQHAIITASRVAVRRWHLAGCQTHWSSPSNSNDQNKGSVTNTDSCNISPGPGSRSISQNTDTEKYFFSHIWIFWGYHTIVVFVGLNVEKAKKSNFLLCRLRRRRLEWGWFTGRIDVFSLSRVFLSSIVIHYAGYDQVFSIFAECFWWLRDESASKCNSSFTLWMCSSVINQHS